MLDRVVLQYFSNSQTVAPTQDQNILRIDDRLQARVHEGLVIAIFVSRTKLEVSAEEQPQIVFPTGEHNSLVWRGLGKNNFVSIEIFLRQSRDAAGVGKAAENQK